MELTTICIIDMTLYVEPFYGGDHQHEYILDKFSKNELLEQGVPEWTNHDMIDAHFYNMPLEEYYEMLKTQAINEEEERLNALKHLPEEHDSDLPF